MATFSATVTAAKVAATLTDYPSYIDLSEMPASFWSTVTNGGGDIRCYSDEALTTELAREVVSCDTATDTGELHVKIPSLTTSTVIYITVDGTSTEPAVGSTYGRNAVWSDYAAVYHFQSDASDSSGNQSDGTVTGATNGADKIGNGYDFDGTDDEIDFGRITELESQGAYTLSAWHSTDLGTDAHLWGSSLGAGSSNSQAYYENTSPTDIYFAVSSINNRLVYPTTDMTADQKHYLQQVFDGSLSGNSNRLKVYLDGVNKTADGSFVGTIESTSGSDTRNFVIGRNPNGTNFPLNGTFDELRIIQSALSADWISTEYNNQDSPSTFWTLAEAGGATFTPKVMIY